MGSAWGGWLELPGKRQSLWHSHSRQVSTSQQLHVRMSASKKGKKTIIVDGEIYQGEDDPRYIQFLEIRRKQQPTEQPRPATASQTSANPSPAGARFDRNAPPFAVVQQGSMFGLPDLVFFGIRVPTAVAAGLVLIATQFGWRMAVGATACLYFWQLNQDAGQPRPPAAAGQGQAGGQGGGVAGGFAGIMDLLGLRAPPPAQGQGQAAGAQGGAGLGLDPSSSSQGGIARPPSSASPARSTFEGRGNRLGGSS